MRQEGHGYRNNVVDSYWKNRVRVQGGMQLQKDRAGERHHIDHESWRNLRITAVRSGGETVAE